jgi:hypothetical protein
VYPSPQARQQSQDQSQQLHQYLAQQYGQKPAEQQGAARSAPATPGTSQITPAGFQTGSSPWKATGGRKNINGVPHIEVTNTETGQTGWQPLSQSSSNEAMLKLAARLGSKTEPTAMMRLLARLEKKAMMADCGHESETPIDVGGGKTMCENCYAKMKMKTPLPY